MLLSSILQLLTGTQGQGQPKPVENAAPGFDAEMMAAARDKAGEPAAADSVKLPNSENPPKPVPPGPSLEGLLQMVTKLKESDQSRVVDVFE